MGFAVPLVAAAFAPAVSSTIATGVFGLAASTIFTDVLAGALIGAATSAITGGDPLSGALFGGLGAGVSSAFGLGGFGEEVAAPIAASPPGLESALTGPDPFKLGSGELLSGGVDSSGLVSGAQSSLESSLAETGKAAAQAGARANPFSEAIGQGSVPDMIDTDTFGLEAAGGGQGDRIFTSGFFDDLLSDKGVLGALKEGGKYLMQSEQLSDKEEMRGEQDRLTREHDARLRRGGISRENNPILSSRQVEAAIKNRPGVAKMLPHYARTVPYGKTGQSQPLYKTAGYHAGATA